MVSFMYWPLQPRRQSPKYPLYRKLLTRVVLDTGEEKNLLSLWGIEL
jgi:hypothetical protein